MNEPDTRIAARKRQLSPWFVLAWALVIFLIATMVHLAVTAPW